MPRLLWLSQLIPHPPQGGVLQRSYHLIRAAAEAYDVDLLAFRQRAFHPDAESRERSLRALGEFLRVRGVVEIAAERHPAARALSLARSAVSRRPYSVRWNESPEMARAVRELAAGERYDVVHFDAVGMYPYRGPFRGSARVFNHHNVESQMMFRRARHAPAWQRPYIAWEALRLRAYERHSGRDADLHAVVSALDGERLRQVIPGAPTAVVENPVDTDYFRPRGGEKRAGRVVFVGRIDAYTNLAAVRWLRDEIWPLLRRGGAAQSLGIVGRNPPAEVVRWGESAEDVEVTGFVDDVRDAMDAAEVYVCPIQQGGGTRLKLLDAMAMGLPIVSHPMAIEGLDVVPGEHLLLASDAAGIARAVEGLLKDPDLRARLGSAARARAEERYSLPAVRRHLHDAYARARDTAARRTQP